jgi:hypothetical protein
MLLNVRRYGGANPFPLSRRATAANRNRPEWHLLNHAELRVLALIAGGSPAASVFLLRGQKKVTKEKAAPLNRPDRGALCYSKRQAAAELGRAKSTRGRRTVLAEFPATSALLGGSERERTTSNPRPYANHRFAVPVMPRRAAGRARGVLAPAARDARLTCKHVSLHRN